MRGASALVAGLAIALLTSCSTSRISNWIGDSPRPQTKDDLFEMYGLPDAIRTSRKGEATHWLRYDSAEVKGMRFGAGMYGISFSVGRQHRGGDLVWFGVSEDGRVVDVVAGQNSTAVSHRLWPFSD